MNIYRSGTAVTLTVALVNSDNQVLNPSSISYGVYDSAETLIAGPTAASGYVSGDPSVDITIAAQHNTLTQSEAKSIRTVVIDVTEVGGHVERLTERYLIEPEFGLKVATNSYMTFSEANLFGSDISQLIGWAAATDEDRKTALIEAHSRIGRLKFNDPDVGYIVSINDLTGAELATLSKGFLIALKKAQLSEADIILGGDPVQRKREEGLLSDSVGESSVMFRPGKPLLMNISRRSLNFLTGYIVFNSSIGRS